MNRKTIDLLKKNHKVCQAKDRQYNRECHRVFSDIPHPNLLLTKQWGWKNAPKLVSGAQYQLLAHNPKLISFKVFCGFKRHPKTCYSHHLMQYPWVHKYTRFQKKHLILCRRRSKRCRPRCWQRWCNKSKTFLKGKSIHFVCVEISLSCQQMELFYANNFFCLYPAGASGATCMYVHPPHPPKEPRSTVPLTPAPG